MLSLEVLRVRRGRLASAVVAAMLAAGVARSAHAEEPSDYCKRVTAHAQGDADLLFAPTVAVQLIRYPNSSEPADASGLYVGQGVQPRAQVSLGLVDIYKGFAVLEVAKADCARQKSAIALQESIGQPGDVGRLPALEAKLAFMREHKTAVDDLVRKAEDRLTAQTGTLADVQDLRIRALAFERAELQTERDIAVLRASGASTPKPGELATELATYEKTSVKLEERQSHVKKIAPWRLNLTGGITGSPSVDVYGIAELSYNFGGLFQNSAENRAVEARANELKTERSEMRQQLEKLTREVHAAAGSTREEAKTIARALERMAKERASIEATEAPNKHAMISSLSMTMLDLEAEQAYLTALADRQASFEATR